jgi:Ca2+-transporting ATPase
MNHADKPWHSSDSDTLLTSLASSAQQGLSADEARRRLASHGPNSLPEAARSGIGQLILAQFRDLMIQILILAAVVAAFIGEPLDALAILLIVTLNAAIGAVQQYRAETAIAALRQLAAPSAEVVREGRYHSIAASELVPGDIAILEAGAIVPADMRLLEAQQLQADESMLTGESSPVEKQAATLEQSELPLGDRSNMAYRSTLVTRGRGRGLVVSTGTATEIGSIADLLGSIDLASSPLQQRLTRFSKRLALVILGICALLFLVGILRGEPWLLMLLTAVSLAVAAIPEALPAVVSISLAMGAHRMSSKNALVRNLPAVETLGSVSVICADKTGTLTMNRMHAELAISAGGEQQLPDSKDTAPGLWQLFGQGLALSNDVQLNQENTNTGDPTEIALFEMAQAAGYDKAELEHQLPRLAEIPFTSERKLMTTLHQSESGVLVFTKGAPETVITRCRQVLTDNGSMAIDPGHWQEEVERLSNQGYRVLALACQQLDSLPQPGLDGAEEGLTLLGLVALIDPPREGAIEAVRECREAGITTVMITGDHPGTAREIARRLGIAEEGATVITGQELETIADEELAGRVLDNRVYARVSPAQKIRLVKALQARGQFIAMTGDGVNDAPALRQADIGVAMGLKGTDVAREAASMVLLDDNFTTIVGAVREGRRIFDNIRKFVKYTMTSNSGEIWTLALAPLFGLPLPLLPVHILWINLVTDGLPGLALTTQPRESHIMQRPPRPPNESLFSQGMWQHILVIGLLIGAVSLGVQAWALDSGLAHWQTMVFTVLTFSQLANVLVIRNDRDSLFTSGLFQNRPLIGAVLLTVLLQLAVIYLPPLNAIFHTSPLSPTELLICCALPLVIVAAVETEKWLVRAGLLNHQAPAAG